MRSLCTHHTAKNKSSLATARVGEEAQEWSAWCQQACERTQSLLEKNQRYLEKLIWAWPVTEQVYSKDYPSNSRHEHEYPRLYCNSRKLEPPRCQSQRHGFLKLWCACNAGHSGSVPGLGRPPEKGMTTHSSILGWTISWTEEPGGLQSTGWQRVGTQLSD